MPNILVTGGAGYVGSVTVKKLLDQGHTVTVIDNLYKGRREAVDSRAVFLELDICDPASLQQNLTGKNFEAIIHFAAFKDAGESMVKPEKYCQNIIGLMNVIEISTALSVKKIVFSSSAAVYGTPQTAKVSEDHPCHPTNFYGYTKLAGEELLAWHKKIHSIDYVALRYFNVAGDGGLQYVDPKPANIFNMIGEVLSGRKKELQIYGDDYDTVDGTGVRDYIHVSDLANAHIKALDVKGSHILNLGSEQGYSVLEIVNEFERISGKSIPRRIIARRAGDVGTLVASFNQAKEILGWTPALCLKDMVSSTCEAYKIIKKN